MNDVTGGKDRGSTGRKDTLPMGLLLKGGMLVDGTGAPRRPADIRIRDGKIADIAENLEPDGEDVLNLDGALVTPGFIDTHTHYDASLFWDPSCDPILLHGVTSVLIGNCSLGLAPLHAADRPMLTDLFSFIEDVPTEVFDTTVPWSWESFEDYAAELKRQSFGPNVMVLVSHSLLRTFVLGEQAWTRSSTPDERAQIAELLDRALSAGAIGMSSSFIDRSSAGDPVPSFRADDQEFDALFEVLSRHSAVFQFVARVNDIEQCVADVERIGAFSARHAVTVLALALFQYPDDPGAHVRVQDVVRSFQAEGAPFHLLASPRPIELPLRFHDSMTLFTVPAWNEIVKAPLDEKFELAADPDWRARARADWSGCTFDKRLAHLRIIEVGAPQFNEWIGSSLADLVAARGGDPSDVLADWVIENAFATSFVFPALNFDVDAVADMLTGEGNIISASDAGAHYRMFCGAGDTSLILSRHVRERGDMTIEDAVKRMTCDQARVLGIADRGVVAPGFAADLAVFRLEDIQWQAEHLVADVPGGSERFTRRGGGFLCSIVNGQIAQRDGIASGVLAGRSIDRQSAAMGAAS